jgi:hypothetical protein
MDEDLQMCENCATDYPGDEVEECPECGYLYCGGCTDDHDCEGEPS